MIYLILLLLILFGVYYYDYRQNYNGRLVFLIFILIYMICLVGFRYRMGIDSIKYENLYNWQQHTIGQLTVDDFKDTRFQPFWVILTALCFTISDEFMLLQFVIAIIVNCTVFYFLWKNTRRIFFAVLLYYFFLYLNLNMEVLREALAVCTFLWAWPFFKKGKWLLYYLMCCVAFLFHLSAIVLFFLPILWIPGIRWFFQMGSRTWIICALVLFLSFAVNYFFFNFIEAVAMTENMVERAQEYSKNDLGGNRLNIFGAVGQLIKFFLYPAVALYFVNLSKKKKGEITMGWNKQVMMTLVALYFALSSVGIAIFSRFNNYFQFFSFLIMSDWIFSILEFKGKRLRLQFLTWIILFLPLFGIAFYTYMLNNYNKDGTLKQYMMFYPYSNQFDKELDPQREKIINYSRKR